MLGIGKADLKAAGITLVVFVLYNLVREKFAPQLPAS